MNTDLPWYVDSAVMQRLPATLDTPTLVVDLAVVRENVRRTVSELNTRGVELWPHAKTHKSPRLARLLAELGATGVTVATLSEAEVFAADGATDLFVAYPVWTGTPAKAERLRRVAAATSLRVGVDSVEGARALGSALRDTGLNVGVLVELDCGDHRSGTTVDAAVPVADAVRRAGLDVLGVFTHGGHSYADPSAASQAAADEINVLVQGAQRLTAAGHDIRVLSAGSTPTALASGRGGVTQVRPGTFVFGDRQQVMLGSATAQDVALVVASTVVSAATPGQFVLDAGAKTLSKDRHPLLAGFGHLPRYPEGVIARVYDHHAVVEMDGLPPAVGEVVMIVPNHVCPVVNLARDLIVLDGADVESWPIDAQTCNA